MGKSLAAILLKNLMHDAFFAAHIGICNLTGLYKAQLKAEN